MRNHIIVWWILTVAAALRADARPADSLGGSFSIRAADPAGETLRPVSPYAARMMEESRREEQIMREREQRAIDSMREHTPGYPVTLGEDTLYMVYARFGASTLAERARLNSQKILDAANTVNLTGDSLYVVTGDTYSDIMYGESIIASITDEDAIWMDSPRQEIAADYLGRIENAIAEYRRTDGALHFFETTGLFLLVLMALVLFIKGTNYLFHEIIEKKFISRKSKWFRGVRIRNLEIVDTRHELKSAFFISKVLRWIVYVILCYATVLVLFGLFPATKPIADTLLGWIWNPLRSIGVSFVNYLPRLIRIIIIVAIFHYIVKFLRYLSGEIASGKLVIPGFYADWAKATFNIMRIFLYAFMVILVYPYLPDSDSWVFQGVSIFLGALFTLGSTTVIGNLMAGMVITYMRPFRKGDRIKIGEVMGEVIEKSPFVVRVKTIKNEIITVPNLTVLSSNVVNYSSTSEESDDGLILNSVITVGYDVPWRTVTDLLIKAALETENIVSDPKPFVLQTAFNDFSASYQINAYTKHPELQPAIYSRLFQNIQDTFLDAGIELIIPHYQAIRDGNGSTIPGKGSRTAKNKITKA